MLTDDSLEFAKRHIQSFYDTDFYPKPFEFLALWHSWDGVKNFLLNTPLDQIHTAQPCTVPWAKAKGGYRVVHQLEPLDAIVYTALVYLAANDIERVRMDHSVACSYRIEPDRQSFFAKGSGFPSYRNSCEQLSEEYEFVLTTDVSDFYNQIYLHRVGNIVESVSSPRLGKEIEQFLSRLNNKASQGIPIGPAASIVLAEAIMIDVDQFISNHHVPHARYVDDIRVFSDSKDELVQVLENLVIYLHEHHRLGLASEKTRIIETSTFLREELQNQYQFEKLEILSDIEVGNQYGVYQGDEEDYETVEDTELGDVQEETEETEEWGESDSSEEELGDEDDTESEPDFRSLDEKLLDALLRAKDFGYVDLAVLRAIIRRAKIAKTPVLAQVLIEDLEFFAPIVNDVSLYLASLDLEDVSNLVPHLVAAYERGDFCRRSIKMWMEWLITRNDVTLKDKKLRKFALTGTPQFAANAAMLLKNMAWAKESKTKILTSATWNRRAYIHSLVLLSKDERSKYISLINKNTSLTQTERWVCSWVKEGCPDPVPEEEDPFGEWDDVI
ncbi:RNA-directed DNA polymerase [Pseudomonas aeruginosa]|uniref:RNA-directed DNA polymerase n=1 Tax=Pseudomonas aeruginosa TaxID=287 RepID=UPI0032E499F5